MRADGVGLRPLETNTLVGPPRFQGLPSGIGGSHSNPGSFSGDLN